MDKDVIKKIDLDAYDAEFAREELIYNCTEDLLVTMQDRGVSKADLAKMLGTSKANVSQMLSGSRNLTLNRLSDIAYVLDLNINLKIESEDHSYRTNHADESPWEDSEIHETQNILYMADYKIIKKAEDVREYA